MILVQVVKAKASNRNSMQ